MRFLRIFFLILITFAFLVFIGYVGWIEIMVRKGAWALRQDLEKVSMLSVKPLPEHLKMCVAALPAARAALEKDHSLEAEELRKGRLLLKAYQLRFISPTRYVLEYVCNSEPEKKVEFATATLFPGLGKVAGSGVVFPVNPEKDKDQEMMNGVVTVKYGYRLLGVGLFKGKLGWKTITPNNEIGEGESVPMTVCEGWGMACCAATLEVGEGRQERRAIDCPQHCYAHCGQRPLLIFLNTDPLLDYTTRTVIIFDRQTEVSFGFEVVDADSVLSQLNISFGDGAVYQTTNMSGVISHTYSCSSNECNFEVLLSAVDSQGYSLSENKNTKLTVILKGQ